MCVTEASREAVEGPGDDATTLPFLLLALRGQLALALRLPSLSPLRVHRAGLRGSSLSPAFLRHPTGVLRPGATQHKEVGTRRALGRPWEQHKNRRVQPRV